MNRHEIIELIDALPSGQKSTPGKRLRLLRKHFGFGTQADLADALSRRGTTVQYSTISRLENDDLQPSIDTLEAAADEFGVSLDWLRCRAEKLSPPARSHHVIDVLESLPAGVRADAIAEFEKTCERIAMQVEANQKEWAMLFSLIERAVGIDGRRRIEREIGISGPGAIEKLKANFSIVTHIQKVPA